MVNLEGRVKGALVAGAGVIHRFQKAPGEIRDEIFSHQPERPHIQIKLPRSYKYSGFWHRRQYPRVMGVELDADKIARDFFDAGITAKQRANTEIIVKARRTKLKLLAERGWNIAGVTAHHSPERALLNPIARKNNKITVDLGDIPAMLALRQKGVENGPSTAMQNELEGEISAVTVREIKRLEHSLSHQRLPGWSIKTAVVSGAGFVGKWLIGLSNRDFLPNHPVDTPIFGWHPDLNLRYIFPAVGAYLLISGAQGLYRKIHDPYVEWREDRFAQHHKGISLAKVTITPPAK